MKIQIVGLGNVGTSLIKLLIDRKDRLKDAGLEVLVASVSDSSGTAVNMKGLDLLSVLRYKQLGWKGFGEYVNGYGALSAIQEIESDKYDGDEIQAVCTAAKFSDFSSEVSIVDLCEQLKNECLSFVKQCYLKNIVDPLSSSLRSVKDD